MKLLSFINFVPWAPLILTVVISTESLCAQNDHITIKSKPEWSDSKNGSSHHSSVSNNMQVSPNDPKGFLDINFGSKLEDVEQLLINKNYKFQTQKNWQQINIANASIADEMAREVILTFDPNFGFYKGEAKVDIDCKNDKNKGTKTFDSFVRIINGKYKKIPKIQEKIFKDKRNYWKTEWEFKTKDNKNTAYEIMLYLYDDWNNDGGVWKKTSRILVAYKASLMTPNNPLLPETNSHGL